VPDGFLWGSRRFPPDLLLPRRVAATDRVARYNDAAEAHEHVVARYCLALGTSLPAVVAREDRIAARYLRDRPDAGASRIGCIGLSGGGVRAALLRATSDDVVGPAVMIGSMSTYDGLLDRHVALHSWMWFVPGLRRFADWPELAGCRAPEPLLVQYNRVDELFTPAGMRRAHAILRAIYGGAGAAGAYRGEFFDGGHKFDVPMQERAASWLARRLAAEKARP
jgi:dienelactone hydrolase